MKAIIGALAIVILMIGAPLAYAQPPEDYLRGYTQGTIDAKDSCIDTCHQYVLEPGHGFTDLTWDKIWRKNH
jgi:hypothetical protein